MNKIPAALFKEYLDIYGYSPQQFARLSGMPLNEVHGIMDGRLDITKLRANHLAAVFNTPTHIWTDPTKTLA